MYFSANTSYKVSMNQDMTITIALGAGLLSFFSPCTLPMIPLYLSYTTGKSVQEIKDNREKNMVWLILSHSIIFLLGISVVYLSLGLGLSYASSYLGSFFSLEVKTLLNRLTGLLILIFGMVTVGWLEIPALLKDRRMMKVKKAGNYFSTFLVGVGFSAGWTPCIGPIFTSIILLGNASKVAPLGYLLAYILGFSIPFLVLSFFVGKIQGILKHTQLFMKIGGFCLIIIGLLMISGLYFRLIESLIV